MDPRFSYASSLDGETCFSFILWNFDFFFKGLESSLILVFFKGKQNKNENLCDSLFRKNMSTKIEYESGVRLSIRKVWWWENEGVSGVVGEGRKRYERGERKERKKKKTKIKI